MARTIVYSGAPDGLEEAGAMPVDGYKDKLVKYVPAEVLGGFLPLTVLVAGDPILLRLCLVGGAVATLGYLWLAAQPLPNDQRPLPQFYLFALVAFLVWAFATSEAIARTFGADARLTTFVLAFTVFLLPVADGVLTGVTRR